MVLPAQGMDQKGTGHFIYESQSGLQPYLKVTNRNEVLAWLAAQGATQQLNTDSSPHYWKDENYAEAQAELNALRPHLDG